MYAYLKEELVNTPESSEVKYLKEKFPDLVKFVNFMDELSRFPEQEPATMIDFLAKHLCPFYKGTSNIL